MDYANLAVWFFGVHYIGTQHVEGCTKCLNILQHVEGNPLKSVLTWLMSIKFIEIYMHYSNSQQNNLLEKWVYVSETYRVQGHTKE